jgi:hypothetical protein
MHALTLGSLRLQRVVGAAQLAVPAFWPAHGLTAAARARKLYRHLRAGLSSRAGDPADLSGYPVLHRRVLSCLPAQRWKPSGWSWAHSASPISEPTPPSFRQNRSAGLYT